MHGWNSNRGVELGLDAHLTAIAGYLYIWSMRG